MKLKWSFAAESPASPHRLCCQVSHAQLQLCMMNSSPAGDLQARGNIEAWLTSVEQNMISSLRRLARSAYQSYPTTPRTEWVLQQPAQLVLVVSQIFWCVGVEKCLTAPDPGSALPEFLKTNVGQLQVGCQLQMMCCAWPHQMLVGLHDLR